MIPLQECYETGFEDVRRDSKEPSATEILEWSEQWAHQLQLGGNLDPESFMDYTLDDSIPDVIPYTTDLLQQEQDVAELHNFNFRSIQDHPHKRKEANQLVDNLLRDASVPDNNILQYGEVLPFKIAQLHQIKCPQPVVHKIPVWLYKKNINADRFRSASKDLHCFLIEAQISLEDLQRQLHQAANSSLPRDTEWEYSLLKGPCTKRSSSNSGILRRSSDWRNVCRQILSPENPHHAMIVFQRFDMHKSYRPLPTLDECQEMGMSKVDQLTKDAQSTQTRCFNAQNPSMIDVLHQNGPSYPSHDSIARSISIRANRLDSGHVRQPDHVTTVNTDDRNGAIQSASSIQPSQTPQPVLQSVESKQTPDSNTFRSANYGNNASQSTQDSSLSFDEAIAVSRYLTVWLEENRTVDQQANHVQCDASQSRP